MQNRFSVLIKLALASTSTHFFWVLICFVLFPSSVIFDGIYGTKSERKSVFQSDFLIVTPKTKELSTLYNKISINVRVKWLLIDCIKIVCFYNLLSGIVNDMWIYLEC